jgi:RNase H-like domain found in reverse transcriptase
MVAAFKQIKQLLCTATSLAHPDPAAGISLAVDASDTHVGTVLQQGRRASKQPLAYYSKKLDAAQRNYSAFDRELLAAYLAVRHFRYSLEGRRFTLYTDHKPLTFALRQVADPWTARQQR